MRRITRWASRVPMAVPVAGCLGGITAAEFGWAWAWAGVLVVPLVAAMRGRRWLWAAGILTGALFWGLHGARLATEVGAASWAGTSGRREVRIVGTLVSLRDEEGLLPRAVLRIGSGSPNPVDLHGALIGVRRLPGTVRPGDRLGLTGRVQLPRPPRNPGEFDRLEWMRTRGIAFDLVPGRVESAGPPSRWLALHRRAWDLRLEMKRRLGWGLDADGVRAALIRALVLGDRSGGDPGVFGAFRTSGTMHVFAVSGLHVGLVGGLAWGVILFLRVRRGCGLWLVLGVVWSYAFVTGLRPPALRASIMATVLLLGFALKRRPSLANSLLASMPLVLVFDSYQVKQAGFQLSYVVVATIILAAPFLYRLLEPLVRVDPFMPRPLLTPSQRRWQAWRQKVAGLLVVSTAAWLGSMPLIAGHFGMVTPAAILASVLLVPVAFAILAMAFIGLGLGLFSEPMEAGVNRANGWLAMGAYQVARQISAVPGSHFVFPRPGDCGDGVVVFDLWGGDGAVYCGAGGGLLIDAGDQHEFWRVVYPALRRAGRPVDSLALTHPDGGHLGGLAPAIEEFAPRRILLPVRQAGSPGFRNLRAVVRERGCREFFGRTGDRLPLGDGVELEVLRAPGPLPGGRADDRGMVLRLHWNQWRILLTGDAGFEVEKELLEAGIDLRSDLWIMGRHESDLTGHLEFVRAVRPRVIVAGEARFPPEQRIPARWAEAVTAEGIDLWRQSETGAVLIDPRPGHLDLRSFLDPDRHLRLKAPAP